MLQTVPFIWCAQYLSFAALEVIHGDGPCLGAHGQPLAARTVAEHVESADGRKHLHQPSSLQLSCVQAEHYNVHNLYRENKEKIEST